MLEAYLKKGGVKSIQTGIVALELVNMLAGRAIVAQSPDSSGEFAVVGYYSPSIAECTQILGRIKAEG